MVRIKNLAADFRWVHRFRRKEKEARARRLLVQDEPARDRGNAHVRVRGIAEWTRDHRYTRRLRELNRQPNTSYDTFKKGIEHADPAIAANVMIGLIKLTNYLLDQQLKRLEQVRQSRDQVVVDAALRRIETQAADPEINLMPALIDAVSVYATLGEVMTSLGSVFGRHVEVPII